MVNLNLEPIDHVKEDRHYEFLSKEKHWSITMSLGIIILLCVAGLLIRVIYVYCGFRCNMLKKNDIVKVDPENENSEYGFRCNVLKRSDIVKVEPEVEDGESGVETTQLSTRHKVIVMD